jgi:F-type H+-transporting ATPase subunit epsilon
MANLLKFEITTPERVVLTREADSVTLPTADGEITVMPGHVPLVGVLRSGMITVRLGTDEEYLAVAGGFVEVSPDGRVAALADSAERAEDLDLAKLETARVKAEQSLEEMRRTDDVSAAAALAALEHELARVKVARRHRDRRPLIMPNQE